MRCFRPLALLPPVPVTPRAFRPSNFLSPSPCKAFVSTSPSYNAQHTSNLYSANHSIKSLTHAVQSGHTAPLSMHHGTHSQSDNALIQACCARKRKKKKKKGTTVFDKLACTNEKRSAWTCRGSGSKVSDNASSFKCCAWPVSLTGHADYSLHASLQRGMTYLAWHVPDTCRSQSQANIFHCIASGFLMKLHTCQLEAQNQHLFHCGRLVLKGRHSMIDCNFSHPSQCDRCCTVFNLLHWLLLPVCCFIWVLLLQMGENRWPPKHWKSVKITECHLQIH